ncbi:Uncharacterised protein [Serratia fonticola]|uniref:Uncharacterized protein n=1 Tax=Serratia fonticola TaxID=47917 RepID=A0A4U9VAQ3_SERFO|nr:Uncharacterised protein [Serratia fonticola]
MLSVTRVIWVFKRSRLVLILLVEFSITPPALDIVLDLIVDFRCHTALLTISSEEIGYLIGFFIDSFFQLVAVQFQFAGFWYW